KKRDRLNQYTSGLPQHPTSVMKLLNRCGFCLLFFLCVAVIGREIPEILHLADDVSNDGQVARYRSEWRCPAGPQQVHSKPQFSFKPPAVATEVATRSSALNHPSTAGQFLLHLLVVQRR